MFFSSEYRHVDEFEDAREAARKRQEAFSSSEVNGKLLELNKAIEHINQKIDKVIELINQLQEDKNNEWLYSNYNCIIADTDTVANLKEDVRMNRIVWNYSRITFGQVKHLLNDPKDFDEVNRMLKCLTDVKHYLAQHPEDVKISIGGTYSVSYQKAYHALKHQPKFKDVDDKWLHCFVALLLK